MSYHHVYAFMRSRIPSDTKRHTKDARYRLMLFITWLESLNLALDNPQLLLLYRDYLLKDQEFAASTVKSHLATVRSFLRSLLKDGSLKGALVDSLADKTSIDAILGRIYQAIDTKAAPVAVQTTSTHHLNMDEVEVQRYVDDLQWDTLNRLRDSAMICLEITTGIREYEVGALNVSDLRQESLEGLTLHVPPGYGCTERLIPYRTESWVLEVLDTWLRVAGIKEGAVFRGFFGAGQKLRSNRLTPQAVELILARYPANVRGQPVVLKPLDVRHIYARHQYLLGVDVDTIREHLGFSTIQPVMDYLGNASFRDMPAMPYDFDMSRLSRWERYDGK